MENISELFTLIEDTKKDLQATVETLAAKITPSEKLTEAMKLLERKVDHLRQLVEEYKQYKDPMITQEAIRSLQGMGDRFAVDIAAIKKRFDKFESKQWMRILSDDEIKKQYVLAGKPTLAKIGKDFKVTPENAWNYTNAIVKDDRIRWEFYTYCGGA